MDNYKFKILVNRATVIIIIIVAPATINKITILALSYIGYKCFKEFINCI